MWPCYIFFVGPMNRNVPVYIYILKQADVLQISYIILKEGIISFLIKDDTFESSIWFHLGIVKIEI